MREKNSFAEVYLKV